MKSSDEMVNSLLERRQAYLDEQTRKRKKYVRNTVSLCSICLVALLSFGAVQSGLFESKPPVTADVSGNSQEKEHSDAEKSDETALSSAESTQSDAEGSNDVSTGEEDRIVWADSIAVGDNEGLVEQNGDWISWGLHIALKEASDTDIFAVFARPQIDGAYEHEGMSMEEYYLAMSEERNLPEKLRQLLKDGESLKYGEALYTTGTPDGEKWVKDFYDERTRYYGEELLNRYIVDGNFLKEQLENDIVVSESACDATFAYNEAVQAYLTALAQTLQGAYPAEVKADESGLLLFVTREQLASLTAETTAEWLFTLANRDGTPNDFVDAE